MAEEATATQEQAEKKVDGATPEATDWQAKYEAARAHSREWEKKAKANKEAADELEKLKAEQMTEQEKAVKSAERAEAEVVDLKAAAECAETVARVADRANVPDEVVGMPNSSDAGELKSIDNTIVNWLYADQNIQVMSNIKDSTMKGAPYYKDAP